MTIMILHPNPIEAAQFLCDKDLKRALIESREFLLNALLLQLAVEVVKKAV